MNTTARLESVRCPNCGRLAAEATVTSRLRVKCVRCKRLYQWHSKAGGR